MLYQVKANAKITLTVDILGKLPSGYHRIESVMQEIDLFDVVYLEESELDKVTVTTTSAGLNVEEHNLAWKAAHAVRTYCEIHHGVRIHIEKRIPIGSGLAGGSADAAAVIRGLDRLWNLGLSVEEMLFLGERTSMDTCFCLIGGTALVQGKGELVHPIASNQSLLTVIAYPGFPVMSRDAYSNLDWTRVGRTPHAQKMIRALESGEVNAVANHLHNDFEYSVLPQFPILSRIQQVMLDNGALGALLSGSGSSVFGILSPEADGRNVEASLGRLCESVFFSNALVRCKNDSATAFRVGRS